MHEWLAPCRTWLENTYRVAQGHASETTCEFHWVDGNELARETAPELAGALALADEEIGWLFFFLPYSPAQEPPIGHWVNQALGLRARLAREANYTGKKEPAEGEDKDAWQVGLVWLLAKTDEPAWQAKMATLRHESGASEELSFDRVLIPGNDVAAALDQHGLPRLLLASRQLLHKKANQAERWLSADAQVAEKLAGFSEQFSSPMARQHARWLEEQAAAHESAQVDISSAQRRFEGFAVENFRNLKSLEIAAASDEVGSIVLFGPNGTGKSSFIEALSLAVFHRSRRSDDYLVDKDESSRSGGRFLAHYVAPLGNKEARATYHWGNGTAQSFEIFTPDKAGNSAGIVLDQDESRELTQLSADELAAKVLRGYSELAQRLNDELDRRTESAKSDKLEFFRRYGLNSGITKSETAYDRLASEVMSQVKPVPSGFPEWAERIATLRDENAAEAGTLANRWRQFQEMPAKETDTLAKLQMLGADSEITGRLKALLDSYNQLSSETRALLERWESGHTELKQEETEALARMDVWGDFLARPRESAQATQESEALRKALETLARERAEVERRGRETSARQALLDQSRSYLETHWTREHPDTCPVCATQIDGEGGIAAIVKALESECRRDRDDLRTRYALLGKRQQELENRLKAQSLAICPVSATDQDRLRLWLTPFLSGATLEASLADRSLRERLKDDLRHATRLLAKPEIYPDTTAESQRLATEFQKLCDAADTVLAEPQALEEVRKSYKGILRVVMENHLPETLGRVWREITHCLTAALWLLPGEPTMKLEPGKGRQNHRLNLKVGGTDRLARHLYNAAELHTLGLAWFFTLHLARRRFEHAWIALDDPAQDLDQTSFRELTRFLATWLRMYRRTNQPHTLLIALHQEERALDATRATDAQLYLLGWSREQSEKGPASPGVRRQVLLAPGYHPKTPAGLFISERINVVEGSEGK